MTNEAAERLEGEALATKMGWQAAVESEGLLTAVLDAVQAEWDSEDEEDDEPHNRSLEAVAKARAALAEERRATVEAMRPFFERLADRLDTDGLAVTAEILREVWRNAHDATLDAIEAEAATPYRETVRLLTDATIEMSEKIGSLETALAALVAAWDAHWRSPDVNKTWQEWLDALAATRRLIEEGS